MTSVNVSPVPHLRYRHKNEHLAMHLVTLIWYFKTYFLPRWGKPCLWNSLSNCSFHSSFILSFPTPLNTFSPISNFRKSRRLKTENTHQKLSYLHTSTQLITHSNPSNKGTPQPRARAAPQAQAAGCRQHPPAPAPDWRSPHPFTAQAARWAQRYWPRR